MRTSSTIAALLVVLVSAGASTARAEPAADVASTPAERKLSPLGFRVFGGGMLHSGKVDVGVSTDQLLGPGYQLNAAFDVRLGSRLVLSPWAGYSRALAGPMLTRLCEKCTGISGLQAGAQLRATWFRTRALDAWAGYGYSRDYYFATGDGNARFTGGHHHLVFGVDWFLDKTNDKRVGFYVDLAGGVFEKAEIVDKGRFYHVGDPQLHLTTSTGAQYTF